MRSPLPTVRQRCGNSGARPKWAAWVVAGNGSLTLTTSAAAGGAMLRLDAVGAASGSLARLLDGPIASEGAHGLELAACQSMMRRMGGSIRAEPISDGKAVIVELPAAGE